MNLFTEVDASNVTSLICCCQQIKGFQINHSVLYKLVLLRSLCDLNITCLRKSAEWVKGVDYTKAKSRNKNKKIIDQYLPFGEVNQI